MVGVNFAKIPFLQSINRKTRDNDENQSYSLDPIISFGEIWHLRSSASTTECISGRFTLTHALKIAAFPSSGFYGGKKSESERKSFQN
jgi:hypothetical protein